MTSEPRFERQLPAILEELYLGPTPDYRDEVLATAVRTRQRPSWAFAGRWLPMTDIAGRPAFAPRLPWRALGVALLVIALLLVAALVYVGSRHSKVPPPFGPAENGLVAYAANGDIFTLDPVTGQSTAVTSGPDIDTLPQFSPDGARIAFTRARVVAGGGDAVVVVDTNGSHPVQINAEPVKGGLGRVEWAPDSRSLLVGDANDAAVWLYDVAEHAQPRRLAENASAYIHPFRPPDGKQVLINRDAAAGRELAVLDLATGHETVLATGTNDQDLGAARWSPNGAQVVYNAEPQAEPGSQRLFIVNADGTARRQLTDAPGNWFDIDMDWSPDGTRIAYSRYEETSPGQWQVRPIAIVSVADGSVTPVGPTPIEARRQLPVPEVPSPNPGEGYFFDWSPDGSSLLAFTSEAPGHPVLIDTRTGTWRQLPPTTDQAGTPVTQYWQRRAP